MKKLSNTKANKKSVIYKKNRVFVATGSSFPQL